MSIRDPDPHRALVKPTGDRSNGGGTPPEADRSVFAGADRALVLALFAERLRRAGIGVGVAALERSVAALDTLAGRGLTVDDLYWCTRLSFVTEPGQVLVFAAVFHAVFADGNLLANDRARRNPKTPGPDSAHARVRGTDTAEATAGRGLPWATRPSIASTDEPESEHDSTVDLPDRLASSLFAEPDRSFDQP